MENVNSNIVQNSFASLPSITISYETAYEFLRQVKEQKALLHAALLGMGSRINQDDDWDQGQCLTALHLSFAYLCEAMNEVEDQFKQVVKE